MHARKNTPDQVPPAAEPAHESAESVQEAADFAVLKTGLGAVLPAGDDLRGGRIPNAPAAERLPHVLELYSVDELIELARAVADIRRALEEAESRLASPHRQDEPSRASDGAVDSSHA